MLDAITYALAILEAEANARRAEAVKNTTIWNKRKHHEVAETCERIAVLIRRRNGVVYVEAAQTKGAHEPVNAF